MGKEFLMITNLQYNKQHYYLLLINDIYYSLGQLLGVHQRFEQIIVNLFILFNSYHFKSAEGVAVILTTLFLFHQKTMDNTNKSEIDQNEVQIQKTYIAVSRKQMRSYKR